MHYLTNKTFSEIQIGDTASLIRVLTKKDIELFAIMSGDVNPAHVDNEFAKNGIFNKIIAHGMWGGALISTVLGTQLPGPGTIYLNQTLHFHRPVIIGDTITVCVTAIKKYVRKPILLFQCDCINQHNKKVITGLATVLAPTEKIKRKQIKLPEVTLV